MFRKITITVLLKLFKNKNNNKVTFYSIIHYMVAPIILIVMLISLVNFDFTNILVKINVTILTKITYFKFYIIFYLQKLIIYFELYVSIENIFLNFLELIFIHKINIELIYFFKKICSLYK